MAPSNMFSYLRPGHAKRNASSAASPDLSSPPAHPLPSPSQSTEYFASPRVPDNASYTSGSPVSPFPPQLPPIPRVASKLDKLGSATSPQASLSQHSASTGGSSQIAQDRDRRPPSQPTQDQLSPGHENRRPPSRPATASPHTGVRSHGQSLAQVVEDAVLLNAASHSSTHLAPSNISSNYSTNSRSQTSLLSGLSEKLSSTPKPSPSPTTAPHKSGKSRLNLRNPMSLLMRRRSGQTLDPLSDESLVTNRSPSIVPPIPDNYDPSIRGRIVHDFSAPRPNRNFSYNNAYGGDQRPTSDHAPAEAERYSPPKIEREHTPVFREHFDDDTSYEQSQAAIRAEQLANKDFLARNSWQPPPPGHSPPPPPPLPKDSPPVPAQPSLPPPPLDEPPEFASSVLSPVQEAPNPTDAPTEATPGKRKSAKTPPASRSRATSVTDPSFSPAGLPAHLTSRSSRFSFQIAGNDAAQEKLLEERHKQKMAEKAAKQVRMSTNTLDDEYDEYGMDDFDMDGGYEEDIPMLGEEDEYGGLGNQTMSPGINAFDFSSLSIQPVNNPMSPISMNGEVQTPLDANGNPIGYAMSEEMLQKCHLPIPGRHLGGNNVPITEPRGLGLMGLQQGSVGPSKFTPADTPENTVAVATDEPSTGKLDADDGLGDDLYFDDGLIDEQGEVDSVEFDENVFDDPDGPLFDRKVRPQSADELRGALYSNPPGNMSSETGYEADDDTLYKHLEKSEPSLAHKTSVAKQGEMPDFNNLNAYHSALADAAHRAEAEGRFTRKASIVGRSSSDLDDSSSLSNSRPSLIPDDGRFSQETTGFSPDDDGFGMSSGFVDDYDYSDYDSALEDDPMIAAANAEALANDYEGFYGQEFGFYAAAQGEAVNAYGGFFGSSGLGRSVSGRNAVREPNLTPITERSEYSTRNSFISINHFRDSQQPIQSPGLAQLARISPYGWREEEDMSLDSLMKLRKGAFGGSSASLPGSSSNSPRNSSPIGMQYVPRTASPMGHRMVEQEQNDSSLESDESAGMTDEHDGVGYEDVGLTDAANTIPEDYEDESDGNERPESPTLTASDYNALSSPTSHLQAKDIPPIPHTMQMQPPPQFPIQSPSSAPLPMSPPGPPLHSPSALPLQSPSIVPLPMSPGPTPLTSPPPLTLRTSFHPQTVPQSLSPSIPSATNTNSTAPRRASLGLISPVSTTSPMTPSGSGWKGGHSRKGSAADSVTYVRECDEQGEKRWVLERRRTAESGELELVGREIVEGGRI